MNPLVLDAQSHTRSWTLSRSVSKCWTRSRIYIYIYSIVVVLSIDLRSQNPHRCTCSPAALNVIVWIVLLAIPDLSKSPTSPPFPVGLVVVDTTSHTLLHAYSRYTSRGVEFLAFMFMIARCAYRTSQIPTSHCKQISDSNARRSVIRPTATGFHARASVSHSSTTSTCNHS